ncbi:gnt1 [Symbiodinium natans]|uniref:Gnt1 protein n=1 Tax=Symbiodinium natans TaxID=878477 RepID=A0A812TWH6_9DINO|nr:gnt1 [Symbiodinium natans]
MGAHTADSEKGGDNNCNFCQAPSAMFRCSRCKIAKFCNATCFQSAWKTHRSNCYVQDDPTPTPTVDERVYARQSGEQSQSNIAHGRIFVSIAAYCDPELTETLKSMLHQCKRPDLLYVGLVWQGDVEDGEPLSGEGLDDLRRLWHIDADGAVDPHEHGTGNLIPELPGEAKMRSQSLLGGRLRMIRMQAGDARGPCWARYLAQLLWRGEELYLQLDSHMRFVPAWDEEARCQLMMCAKHSSKPVLCSYGRAYPLGMPYTETPTNLTACLNCAGFFDSNNVLNIRYRSLVRDWDEPRASFFWSAHFSFSSADVIREVPYDPRLRMLFFGEEILMTVRLFTNGWDLFSPCSGLVFHLWQRDYRRVYADDMRELYRDLSHSSRKRLHGLLGSGALPFFEETYRWPLPGGSNAGPDAFELGSYRSLAEYEEAAGVSFRNRHLSDFALRGGAPSEDFFMTQEEGGQAAVEMQCRGDMLRMQESKRKRVSGFNHSFT